MSRFNTPLSSQGRDTFNFANRTTTDNDNAIAIAIAGTGHQFTQKEMACSEYPQRLAVQQPPLSSHQGNPHSSSHSRSREHEATPNGRFYNPHPDEVMYGSNQVYQDSVRAGASSNRTSCYYYPPSSSSGPSQGPHGGYANHEAYTMNPRPYVPPARYHSDKAHETLDNINDAFRGGR